MKRDLIVLSAIGAAATWCTPAQAEIHSFDIRAGSLVTGLDAFIRQSGQQILYRPDQIAGRRTAGMKGILPTKAALHRLLAQSDLVFRTDATGAIAIVRRQPMHRVSATGRYHAAVGQAAAPPSRLPDLPVDSGEWRRR